jgi:hypothetical protein
MPVDFIKVTPGNTRSVRIVNATRFHGRHIDEGEELEIEESEAYVLVHCGKAVFSDSDSDAEIGEDDSTPTKKTTKKAK